MVSTVPNTVPSRGSSSSLLNKVPRFALQEALKFLSAKDLVHFGQASKYCNFVASPDYMWRILAESELPFC